MKILKSIVAIAMFIPSLSNADVSGSLDRIPSPRERELDRDGHENRDRRGRSDREDRRRDHRDDETFERIETVYLGEGLAQWRTPTEELFNVDLLQVTSISIRVLDPGKMFVYRAEAVFSDGSRLNLRYLRAEGVQNQIITEEIPFVKDRRMVQLMVKAAYIEGYNNGNYDVTVQAFKSEKRPLPYERSYFRGEIELRMDEQIVVQDYNLIMQGDGNLVLYNRHNRRPLWATNTNRGDRAVFQEDGNFVLYDRHNRPLWDTRTTFHGERLTLSESGFLMIEDARGRILWISNRSDRF